jgi:hypothetical protein
MIPVRPLLLALCAGLFLFAPLTAKAEEYVLTLKNKQFSPKELAIPAGQKIRLMIKNQDAGPAEFESSDLNREKIVPANGEVIVFIGPLSAGRYGYFDDFHRETTGTIIAK